MFSEQRTYENGTRYQQLELDNYFIDYIDKDSDILFVTFEGSQPKTFSPTRYAWGVTLCSNGYSVLGVKSKTIDWYRGEGLHDALLGNDVQDILKKHKRVIFYGYSMGGFGALTFSSIYPGAEVLCYAPISTLNDKKVPWEMRYDEYKTLDWSNAFSDAANQLKTLKKAYIVYDPFSAEDRRHIARLPQDNITLLRAPLMDHDVAQRLKDMKILKDTALRAVDGTLEEWFPKAMRARKSSKHYLSMLHFYLSTRAIHRKDIDTAIDQAKRALEHNINNQQALTLAKMLITQKTRLSS